MEQEYFTPREVAKQLRVDYTTVMRWIRTGILPAETIREGRRNRHRISKGTIAKLKTTERVREADEHLFSSTRRTQDRLITG